MAKRSYRFHPGPRGDDSDGLCGVEDCLNRSHTRGWCGMHYKRFISRGELGPADSLQGRRFMHPNGYWLISDIRHPLADVSGKVYEHRAILWEKLGRPSVSQCHYCGTDVYWFSTIHAERASCDHVDFDRANNDPGNLVVSCIACNSRRGQLRKAGKLSTV